MGPTFLGYGLTALICVAVPVGIALLLHRGWGAGWSFFGIGAVTFIAAQVLHIPFNWLVLTRFELVPSQPDTAVGLLALALFLGLSAAFFEEGMRYLTFRYWTTGARSWGSGLMVGAGHGGVESILVGLLIVANVVVLGSIRAGSSPVPIPAEQMDLVARTVAATFSAPWYDIFLPAAERVIALSAHLAMALMVMLAVMRRQLRWLALALLWHTLLDSAAVFVLSRWGPYAAEGAIACIGLLSVLFVWRLREPRPTEAGESPLPPVGSPPRRRPEVTAEMLERSRYE